MRIFGVKKALTFRPGSIGDCLMGKYFLENIRNAYPDAQLAIVLGNRGGMVRDLFRGEPWVKAVEANRRSLSSLIQLWKEYRKADIVLTYYTASRVNFSIKLFARLLAKRGRLAGFGDISALNPYLYDVLFPVPIRDRSVRLHEVDALKAFDIPVSVEKLTLKHIPIPDVAQKYKIPGPFIIVHLFSGSKTRGLSTEHMRELLMKLSQILPNTHLVLSGGAGDKEEITEASQNLPATVVAGRASLQELMNLMMESRCVVSLDTGVGHIAAHLRRPLVIMTTCLGRISWWGPEQYGPEVPTALFSRNDLCRGGHVFKNYPECLKAIDMDAVAGKVAEITSRA